MIFDPSTEIQLKSWLVRTLEPICDAEPGALANYVVALLRHTGPEAEMRRELSEQLEEFLEKEGPSFIDTLFAALRSKSYLPYSATSPPPSHIPTGPQSQRIDTGIPIPLDGLLTPSASLSPDRGRKRSFDYDERDLRPPAKGPRVNNEGQFSRYTNGRSDHRSTGSWGGSGRGERFERGLRRDYSDAVDMSMAGGMNGAMGTMNGRGQPYRPPDQKRGICRDYFHKGYCARGALCKFSHGEDAVIPQQLFPMNGQAAPGAGMPFGPMFQNGPMPFGGGGSGAAYDPHERIDMRPQGGHVNRMNRAPLLPRVQQEGGTSQVLNPPSSGELPVIQDLTPQPVPDETVQQKNGENGYGPRGVQMGGPVSAPPVDVDMAPPMASPVQRPSRGGMRGRGRGGMFSAEVHNFRPERKRDDKTLVVEKIPQDKLSLDTVNAWFKQFGTVTNVAIDASNAKALVSFSNHDEAHAAWRAEEAVFHNRFVKVFWHRPLEGHGQMGQRMLAASAPIVANMATREGSSSTPAPPAQSATPTPSGAPSSTSTSTRKPSASPAAAALAAKQQLLEQQITEQKALMAQLGTTTGQEKKEVLARLRKLGEEMKTPTPAPAPAPTPSTSSAGLTKKTTPTPRAEDQERKERERLDKELELHAIANATEGGGESTEELKAKLAKLQAEAASLGLPEANYSSTSHRPYRGRGRGRSFYRGAMRGGPPRSSLKLDNRPKKLLVKGVSGDGVQAVRDWYEATGQMESLETQDNDDIVVTFRSRGSAEQGLAKGNTIPNVGQVQISWYTGRASESVTPAPAGSNSRDDEKMGNSDLPQSLAAESHHSPHIQDDFVVSSGGWGDDEEDGMGLL